MMSYQFEQGTPIGCPSNDALPTSGMIYRGIKGYAGAVTDQNFLSHRSLNLRCDCDECACWGLSVWTDMEHVNHARRINKFFKKMAVVEISVTPIDGVIKHTPSMPQPDHHTFWKDQATDWIKKANVIMQPAN